MGRKVIALCAIQRQVDGDRHLIPAGTPFEIMNEDEEKQLESAGAIRDAKESDIKKAEEEGLEVVVRKPRFRTRREIRAVQDSQRDLAERTKEKPADKESTKSEKESAKDEKTGKRKPLV